MAGVDKEKVNRVVYEMSKDSAYFKNAKRHDTRLERNIEEMQSKLRKVTEADLEAARISIERHKIQLEATRNLSRVWAVVDMDMFYAAVAMLDNPSLIGKPVAVGDMSMISTANYEARKYGVRAAMPGFIAKKLCPQLVFVDLHFDRYKAVADQSRKVFAEYDPDFEAMSLDEAYLDITEVCKARLETEVSSSGEATMISVADRIVHELRQKVITATGGLTCSAGIACNPMLAKIASNFNKPNGQFSVPSSRDEIMKFMAELSVRTIPGIGKVAEKELACLGVNTCGDLLTNLPRLSLVMTAHRTRWLTSVALGIQSATRETADPEGPGRKSIGLERTFRALSNPDELLSKCKHLCEKLSQQMKEQGLKAKTVTLKLKTAGFEVRSKSTTLKRFVDDSSSLVTAAFEMLKHEFPVTLRLMGIRMTHFENEKCTAAGIKKYFHCPTPHPSSSMGGDASSEPEVVYISTQTDSEQDDVELLMAPSDSDGSEGPVPPQPKRNKVSPSFPTLSRPEKSEDGDAIEVEGSDSDEVVVVSDTPEARTTAVMFSTARGLLPSSGTTESAICPLCNLSIPGTLGTINRHVDECLGLQTASKAPKKASSIMDAAPYKGKRGSLDAFVTTGSSKS